MIRKITDNKLFYIILAIMAAVLVWVYVYSETAPTDSVTITNIPVTFEGEEALSTQGLVIAHDADKEVVTLRLSGRRTALSQLNRNNVTVTVRCSQITGAGDQQLDYTISYPSTVTSSAITVSYRSVGSIDVSVTKLLTKTIPVIADFTGTVADGYYGDADEIVCAPAELSISGQDEVISQIASAHVTITGTALTQSIAGDYSYVFLDGNGNEISSDNVTCTQDTVSVTMPVGLIHEMPLSITINEGGGATMDNVSYSIEPETITVSGEASVLDSMETLNLGTINLSDIVTMDNISYDIVLPESLENISGESSATVSISISGLSTRRVTIAPITLINPNPEYSVQLLTNEVTVQIRGPEESLAQVLDSYVTASVDLTDMDLSTGTMTVPIDINVAGFGDVGAVGTYKAVITVS